VAHARAILKGDPRHLPINVLPAFETYTSLDAMREPLSHVIYVERDETRIYGVVQFFGVIQVYCGLGMPNGTASRAARIGILDPLKGDERFFDTQLLSLPIPAIVGEEEFSQKAESLMGKFQEEAIKRGATKPINLVGTLSYSS
jgi:hypothetical protein